MRRKTADGRGVGAARSAAALFLLAGVLALLGLPAPDSRPRDLLIVAVADFAVAAACRWLPWPRLPRPATVGIAVAGLVVLAFSTWAFGGAATGTGPFFVLLFAWVGLHHPPWVPAALAPLTAAAYVAPLVATHQPPATVGSAVVFVPVVTAVGVLIAHRVRQLHQARAEIAAQERWRAALMVTLAHDVRSPLAAVQAALELLAEDDDFEPGVRERLTRSALRQVGRIARLANGLLDMGRVEEGALRLDVRTVPLRAAVDEAVSLVPHAPVQVSVDPSVTVAADPERLEQMLINLLTNALRHGEPPFVVSAEAAGPVVCLAVRDHGPGVPPAARDALFARYSGGDSPGSVGLGLWIVRELARAHGGDVRYEPASPGARFVLTLPAPG